MLTTVAEVHVTLNAPPALLARLAPPALHAVSSQVLAREPVLGTNSPNSLRVTLQPLVAQCTTKSVNAASIILQLPKIS